ncbi:hypothetical protein AKO1_008299 [Acrasis kona]|uniref:C2 domain-containing protein n=1 Tax=Acrasis kona TaxID=1008807 RepID=A0AAW2YQ03_9EUKA
MTKGPTLVIEVVKATNLQNKDLFSLSDPYVVIKISEGKQSEKTSVIDNCLNPEWSETFRFPVQSELISAQKKMRPLVISFKVKDKDTLIDQTLGSAELAMTPEEIIKCAEMHTYLLHLRGSSTSAVLEVKIRANEFY